MVNKTNKTRTKQVLCPCCIEQKGNYHAMICATDENGDIIIRCRTCKTDVNVSELMRQNKLNKAI